MKDLVNNVIREVKEMILTERPIYIFVDGPWKVYVKRNVQVPLLLKPVSSIFKR